MAQYVDSRHVDRGSIFEDSGHLSTVDLFQQEHDVKMTSDRLRCDVLMSHRRQYDVISTSYAYRVLVTENSHRMRCAYLDYPILI